MCLWGNLKCFDFPFSSLFLTKYDTVGVFLCKEWECTQSLEILIHSMCVGGTAFPVWYYFSLECRKTFKSAFVCCFFALSFCVCAKFSHLAELKKILFFNTDFWIRKLQLNIAGSCGKGLCGSLLVDVGFTEEEFGWILGFIAQAKDVLAQNCSRWMCTYALLMVRSMKWLSSHSVGVRWQ